MLGTLINSPNLKFSNFQLLFPNGNTENIPKNQFLTPNSFYEIQNTTKSEQLYIHLNISCISYQINNLVSLITNCKTKQKVIRISESRIRTGISHFQIQEGGALLYIDKSLKYELSIDLDLNKPKEIE